MPRFMKPLTIIPAMVVLGLVSFSAVAFAQSQVVQDDRSIVDVLQPIYSAFVEGHYALAAALFIVVTAALIKRYCGDSWKWLNTDAGGSALALVASAASAVAAGLASPGATFTWALARNALVVGISAAGGYAVLKNLFIEPVLQRYAPKAPAWMQRLFRAVLWIFEHGPEPEPTPAPEPPAPAPAPAPLPSPEPAPQPAPTPAPAPAQK